ncbi:MAG: Ig-like domain-containing protein [Clostridia bacterium]|nr:Ig-like domain-containing protein [Clostridia bacterium]
MKTKRILSLVLAVAMLGTMAISASAAETSKVYLTDDFPESAYSSPDHYQVAGGYASFNDAGKLVFKPFDHDGNPETALVQNDMRINGSGPYWSISANNKYNATAVTPEQLRALGYYYYYTNWNASAHMSASTNSRGNSAMLTAFGNSFWGNKRWLHRILAERWTAEENEAFVFTAEIEPIQTTVRTKMGYKAETDTYSSGFSMGGNIYELHVSTVGEDEIATNMSQTGVSIGATKVPEAEPVEPGVKYENVTVNIGGVAFGEEACNKVYDYATVLTPSAEGKFSRQNYVDGVALGKAASVTGNSVESYAFLTHQGISYKAAKARAYSLSLAEGAFNVARTATGLVPTSTVSIPVKFSQPVAAATFDTDAVTITGVCDGEEIVLVNGEDFEITALTEVIEGNEIYSTATIVLNTDLKDDAEYTITFPGTITNTAAIALEGYNTINFTTPTPEIKLNAFNVVKNWGSDAEATATDFVADGTLQLASLKLTNTTEAAKNVAVIYAVYGTNGQLTDVVFADDTVAGGVATEIGAGVTLSETGTVKAFVWDGISSLKPYSKETVKTIAAAQ